MQFSMLWIQRKETQWKKCVHFIEIFTKFGQIRISLRHYLPSSEEDPILKILWYFVCVRQHRYNVNEGFYLLGMKIFEEMNHIKVNIIRFKALIKNRVFFSVVSLNMTWQTDNWHSHKWNEQNQIAWKILCSFEAG